MNDFRRGLGRRGHERGHSPSVGVVAARSFCRVGKKQQAVTVRWKRRTSALRQDRSRSKGFSTSSFETIGAEIQLSGDRAGRFER
jgi:hypothetical protein